MLDFDWFDDYRRSDEDNRTTNEYERLIKYMSEVRMNYVCKSCGRDHLGITFYLQGDLRYKTRCPVTHAIIYAAIREINPTQIIWLI